MFVGPFTRCLASTDCSQFAPVLLINMPVFVFFFNLLLGLLGLKSFYGDREDS